MPKETKDTLDVKDFCFYPADSAYSKNWIVCKSVLKILTKFLKATILTYWKFLR